MEMEPIMSPIVGLFIAIVAGLLAPRPRAVIPLVVPPMLGATAAQAWYLGSGRGNNPAATTANSPAYWVVQVLIIIAICGVAAAVCWLGVRRHARAQVLPTGARQVEVLGSAAIAAFAVTLGLMFSTDRPKHPGTGNGNIPVAGAVAVVIGLVVLAFLAVAWFRRSRRPTTELQSASMAKTL
jgi:O-antigen/teichoic acid export membrane protein